MIKEPKPLDVSDNTDLLRVAQEVQALNEPRLLRGNGEDLAVLMPVPPAKRVSGRKKPFTKADSLWNIVGTGKSGLGDVSENKYKYLAEASSPEP